MKPRPTPRVIILSKIRSSVAGTQCTGRGTMDYGVRGHCSEQDLLFVVTFPDIHSVKFPYTE